MENPLETLKDLMNEAKRRGNRQLEQIFATLHKQTEEALEKTVSIGKEEVSRLKEEAKSEAESILQKARAEAQQLLASASEQTKHHRTVRGQETAPDLEARGEYPLNQGVSDTLVVHCSDPRFQEAFRTFAKEELGLPSYDSLVVPGASQLLTFADSLPKFAQALFRPLKFLVKGHSLKRVVVIMHEDCAWYKDFVPKFVHMKGDAKGQQIKDMLATRQMIHEEFPGLEVRMFYAAITEGKGVRFSEIKETR